jgi:Tol biopolymer transport system component
VLTGVRRAMTVTVTLVAGIAAAAHALPAEQGRTVRISVDSAERQSDGGEWPAMSADGRFIAFVAGKLGRQDRTLWRDVFVRDTANGTTRLVSVTSRGRQLPYDAWNPAISGNGRFVAFDTLAPLVRNDRNNMIDVYLHDLRERTTSLVSVGRDGRAGNATSSQPSVSHNGRFIAFASEADDLTGTRPGRHTNVYVRDRRTRTTRRVSVPNGGGRADGDNFNPQIAGDGSRVAFISTARNLTSQRPATRYGAAFVRDLNAHRTVMVSVSSDGEPADTAVFPQLSISANGRMVAFASDATNLGPGDTRPVAQAYVHVIDSRSTEVVSVNTAGRPLDPVESPVLSADGRHVAFICYANDPSVGDFEMGGDVYVRDRLLGTTALASVDAGGMAAGAVSGLHGMPAISADGSRVAFTSFASDVVEGDTNDADDVFLRIREGSP